MLHLKTHCVKIKRKTKRKERRRMLGPVVTINFAGAALSRAVFPPGEGSRSGADSLADKVLALASEDSQNVPSVHRLLESIRSETH